MRIALLADLGDLVHRSALADRAAYAYEVITGLAHYARHTGDYSVHLFAKKGSWDGVPLVTVDPGELPLDWADVEARLAGHEAAWCQMFLAGLLDGYDVVHSLALTAIPLQLVAAAGTPTVQTLIAGQRHASAILASMLLKTAVRQILPYEGRAESGIRPSSEGALPTTTVDTAAIRPTTIPLGVDLGRFVPIDSPSAAYVLWLGSGDVPAIEKASDVADRLGLELAVVRSDADFSRLGGPRRALAHARVLLHLEERWEPLGELWPMRALACGTPVGHWESFGPPAWKADLPPPLVVSAPLHDAAALAERIAASSRGAEAVDRTRRQLLGLGNARTMIGRYRELYLELSGSAT